ncbi:MAG TPA: GlsB/YeaQ/YmgE family stress response membrane protein [Thermomicrobiaceae bacterium]|nr:GlsB/YeaQ/YmgE family stress response membrane protein [Thermomicrobiaceae bacterium]
MHPIVIQPGSLVGWILLGLLAGWIAGLITRGHGFGCLGNVAIGLIGAVVGGWLFSLIGFVGFVGFLGSLLIAVAGAALVLAVANAIT